MAPKHEKHPGNKKPYTKPTVTVDRHAADAPVLATVPCDMTAVGCPGGVANVA